MPVLQHTPEPDWNVLAPSRVTGCQFGKLCAPSKPELWGWEGHRGAGMWPPHCSAPGLCTLGKSPSEKWRLCQSPLWEGTAHTRVPRKLRNSRGPAPDREVKGPEQRSLSWSKERVFSPSGRSAFGRNWLKQDGPTSQWLNLVASLPLDHGELLLLLLWHHFAVKITPGKYKGKGWDCLKTCLHLGISVSPPKSLW